MTCVRLDFSFNIFTYLKRIFQTKLNFHNDSPSYINTNENNMQSKGYKEKINADNTFILVHLTW